MNNIETIFLAKIQTVINLLNEIDNIIEQNPSKQQEIDYSISDYLHMIQNEELSDKSCVEITKKLKEYRTKREQHNNVNMLANTYNQHKGKLPYKNNRELLIKEIQITLKRLNQDYKYRVLTNEDVNLLVHTETPKEEKHRKSKINISKEEFEELLKTKNQKEISTILNCSPATICVLKKRFGIELREHKKRGE